MTHNQKPRRRGSVKQSTEVRYSDRGFPYAEQGNSEIIGITPSYSTNERPDLKDIPAGVLIHNRDTNCLELSDPDHNRWIQFCSEGTNITLGLPTDGSYEDGAVTINPSGTIADAIDDLNEYLISTSILVLASHLGTTDGSSNGFLVNPTFSIGRIASPTSQGSPFYTNSWDDNTNRDLTNQASLTWQLGSGEKITDLQTGVITATFSGGGGILHTETLALDGTLNTQSSLPGGYITVSGLTNKGNRKEGFLSVTVPINTVLAGSSGYLNMNLKHVVGVDVYAHPLIEFFKDSAGNPAVVAQAANLVSAPLKYLSGVKFATISGATKPIIHLSMSGSNVWRDTYRADPLVVNSAPLGIPQYTVGYNANSVTKAGVNPPVAPYVFNQDFVYSENKEVTSTSLTNPDADGNFAAISFTIRDPFNSVTGATFTPSPQILINTLPDTSNDLGEFFVDELYRLETSASGLSSISGSGRGSFAFDSTLDLNTRPALQVINGALVYPNQDYTSSNPGGNPDYSPLSGGVGDLTYIRQFRDPQGLGRSNGILRIDGLTEADRAAGNILVDIRVVGDHIPGDGTQGPGNLGTGWLSLNTGYNSGTFVGDDGDGCFTTISSAIEPFFEFTLGGFSTIYSENQAIEVRITFKDPAALTKKITRLEIVNWE